MNAEKVQWVIGYKCRKCKRFFEDNFDFDNMGAKAKAEACCR